MNFCSAQSLVPPLWGRGLFSGIAAALVRAAEQFRAAEQAENASGAPADCAQLSRRAEHLLDAWGDHVLRCAYSYLHNRSDAEEILQETLIRYLRTAPALTTPEHEKAWLLRVCANLSKNRLRYNELRRTDELKDELLAENREDLSFVWEAVGQLPERSREVIHLFYYEGCTTGEIAEILGRKEATVRSDLHRARNRLKEVLKEDYDFE